MLPPKTAVGEPLRRGTPLAHPGLFLYGNAAPLLFGPRRRAGLPPLPRPPPAGGVPPPGALRLEALPGEPRGARPAPAGGVLGRAGARPGPGGPGETGAGPGCLSVGRGALAGHLLGALEPQPGGGTRRRAAVGRAGRHPAN